MESTNLELECLKSFVSPRLHKYLKEFTIELKFHERNLMYMNVYSATYDKLVVTHSSSNITLKTGIELLEFLGEYMEGLLTDYENYGTAIL